jgi:hypothetical protein
VLVTLLCIWHSIHSAAAGPSPARLVYGCLLALLHLCFVMQVYFGVRYVSILYCKSTVGVHYVYFILEVNVRATLCLYSILEDYFGLS